MTNRFIFSNCKFGYRSRRKRVRNFISLRDKKSSDMISVVQKSEPHRDILLCTLREARSAATQRCAKFAITRGFLLVEILIYLFLFAIIVGGSVSVFYSLLESSERISEESLESDEAEFILGKINWMLNGNPEILEPANGEEGQKLSVIKNNFPDNPLVLEKVGNDILLQRGENEAHILNNSRVLIEDLNFENIIISNNPSRNILEASFTIASTTYKTSRLIR